MVEGPMWFIPRGNPNLIRTGSRGNTGVAAVRMPPTAATGADIREDRVAEATTRAMTLVGNNGGPDHSAPLRGDRLVSA